MKRDFPAARINRKWYGDGTEAGTGEGKLHLDSVLDMDHGGWSGSRSASITTRSWPTARWRWRWRSGAARCPASFCTPVRAANTPPGSFRRACDRLSITQSMGRPGSALDNAVIEAWHYSALGMRSPVAYENALAAGEAA